MKSRLKLSAKGAVYFCVLFWMMGWLWWFFRSYLLFIALILMVAGAILSAALLWHYREDVYAEAVLDVGSVEKGHAVLLEICVRNRSRIASFTADISYRWGNAFTQGYETKKERVWAAPRTGACVKRLLESDYAGRLEVEIDRFTVYGMFHLFYLTGCERKDASTMAVPVPNAPDTEELSQIVSDFPMDFESRKRGTDYNPDYELREYIPGDELKSIHWKLTAKQNRLMVRERLAAGREKMNVLLPLGDDKKENDGLMDALCRVCLQLLEKEYPVQLFCPGKGEELQTWYVAEQGEFERAVTEILSGSGLRTPGSAQRQMDIARPGERYILIQTGAYQGAYI